MWVVFFVCTCNEFDRIHAFFIIEGKEVPVPVAFSRQALLLQLRQLVLGGAMRTGLSVSPNIVEEIETLAELPVKITLQDREVNALISPMNQDDDTWQDVTCSNGRQLAVTIKAA